jgi:hypothetical protein
MRPTRAADRPRARCRGSRQRPVPPSAAEIAAATYLAPYAFAKSAERPGKLGEAMDGQPSKHVGRRLRARRWRAALLWVGALAALALAAWIATRAALALSGLLAPTTRENRAVR